MRKRRKKVCERAKNPAQTQPHVRLNNENVVYNKDMREATRE